MPSKYERTGLSFIWICVSIIILDQLTKYAGSHYLQLNHFVVVFSFFNVVLVHNTGGAFSFLANASGWQNLLFEIVIVIVGIILFLVLYKLPKNRICKRVSLALILGGAIGNLLDRTIHGFVIDLFDFHVGYLHWPAFNIADSAIVIGVVLLAVNTLKFKKNR